MMLRRLLRSLQRPSPTALLAEGELAPEWHLLSEDGTWHSNGGIWRVLLVAPTNTHDWLRHLQHIHGTGAQLHVLGKDSTQLPTLIDLDGIVTRQFGATPGRPATFLVNPLRKVRMAQSSSAAPVAVLRSIQALTMAAPERM
jgi:hypothetical protein